MLIIQLVITYVIDRHSHFRERALHRAGGGVNRAVARVPAPAYGTQQGIGDIAEGVNILLQAQRRAGLQFQLGAFDRHAVAYAGVFSGRYAESYAAAPGAGRVFADCRALRVGVALIHIKATAYTIIGVIGIGVGYRIDLVDFAGVDLGGKLIAAAEQIGLGHARIKHHAFRVAIPRARRDVSCGFFLDRHVDVHLVGHTLHRGRFDIHFGKKVQLVHTLFGFFDFFHIEPRAFDLAKFAADDFIAGFVVARYIDAADISALAGIDHKIERDLMFFLVNLGYRIHVGKRIAFRTQPFADVLAGFGQCLARKSIARFHSHQAFDLFFGDRHFTCSTHL